MIKLITAVRSCSYQPHSQPPVTSRYCCSAVLPSSFISVRICDQCKIFFLQIFCPKIQILPVNLWNMKIIHQSCCLLSSLPLASRHLLQIMKRNLQKIAACKFLAVSQGREIPNNGLADRTVKSWYLFMCRVRWPRFICVNNVMHRKCHITLGWPCHGRAASRGHSAAGTGTGFCFIKRLQIIFN